MAHSKRFSLAGKRILVTGAARGVGRAVAEALAEEDAQLALLDVDEKIDSTAAELDTHALNCDVTHRGAVDDAVTQATSLLGGLDGAVNNAGIVTNAPAEEMSDDDFDRVLDVDLRGVYWCARAEDRVMLERGVGSIVNTASMSARIVVHPQPQCAYNAAKAGVVGLTRSLAAEWAARGVRVNSVSPGYTLAELVRTPALMPQHEAWRSLVPAGRLAEVDDLVGAFVYLLSDASAYTVGHDLVVDGGYTLW